MRVVIRCCKVVAIFATAARQAPRRGRMLRRREPEQTLPCGLHKAVPWLVPLAAGLHSTPARHGCGYKSSAFYPCSILPGLRGACGARQNGCWHPVNNGHFGIFAVSLLDFHFDFLLFFVYGEQFIIQIIPCSAGKGNTERLCRMARSFSASFLIKRRVFLWR